MALLVLAFAGQNVSVASGTRDISCYGAASLGQHAALLFDQEGKLDFDMDTLRIAARSVLVDVLSCRENRSASGVVARVAGDVIAADGHLPNMGTEEFLSCLSRPALEAACTDAAVLPRQKVKDTRTALVEHFREGRFVHPTARFAPDPATLSTWLAKYEPTEAADDGPRVADTQPDQTDSDGSSHDAIGADNDAWAVAAE